MAHKSHRQKALQSQLEPAPAISLVTSQPKASSSSAMAMDLDSDEDELLITSTPGAAASASAGPSSRSANIGSALAGPETAASSSGFAPLSTAAQSTVLKNEFRRVPIPPHRMSPLKREWVNIYTPMVEMLGLQVRMNVKRRCVEMKVGRRGRGRELERKHTARRYFRSPHPVLASSPFPLRSLVSPPLEHDITVLHLLDLSRRPLPL
jgi:RNA-binding protein PNO1